MILNNYLSGKEGYSLWRVLLVIFLIFALIMVLGYSIRPDSESLMEARNTQRSIDAKILLDAVYEYSIDHNGDLPESITEVATEICQYDELDCTGYIDLSELVDNGNYLEKIPVDPLLLYSIGTGYAIHKTDNSRIVVESLFLENKRIVVSR
jgi:hypothetical protein